MNDAKKPGEDDGLGGSGYGMPPEANQGIPQNSSVNAEGWDSANSYSAGQSEQPRRSTAAEVASGLGISALVYALLWAAFASQVGVIIIVLSLVLLGGGMIWSIKLMRSGRTALGLTLLTAFSIPLLSLLTVGACALLFFPPWG